ncbi:unnamed protein product [[Actinomadura] parvosata subsp. kistnae]|uniref:hypothetical protein n=1 Tax=[Actinomadura] parvosata TaxID=1955412 RepID=UPI000D296F4D|nr:unnamed protein product [Actinomadura parvosata subsp. kistnae]
MSDDSPPGPDAARAGLGFTVLSRSDGWPALLGRRPLNRAERAELRRALDAEPEPGSTDTTPDPLFLAYLTIDGLDREGDPRKAMRLRGRILAAARSAAEQRRTTFHATETTVTVGIYGTDAAARITVLRTALAALVTKHGLAARDEPW